MAAGLAAVAVAVTPAAGHDDDDDRDGHKRESFDHVGTFYVPDNLLPGDPPDAVTAAEIVDVTPDGINTGTFAAPSGELVVVDISSHANVRRIALAGQPDSWRSPPTRSTPRS